MPLYTSANSLSLSGVNNGIKDPFQGYDCNLWMLDATGTLVNRGFFTSVQFTFRNATEPYMELSQRVPRYLDGDFQIGWVAQRGMLDVNAIRDTMGFPTVTRSARVSRSPRFVLVLYIDAQGLIETSIPGKSTLDNRDNLRGANSPVGIPTPSTNTVSPRQARGKIMLLNCKLDTFAMGIQSGQRVVANQWEGLAEGYQVLTEPGDLTTERAALDRVVLNNDAVPTEVIPGVNKSLTQIYRTAR